MPQDLVTYLTPENFNYLMGMSGLVSGLVVWMLWSKGI